MRGHRLARPYGAGFAGGVVAGGEHEIERRRARPRELVPRDAIGRLTLGRISVFGARPSVSATPGPNLHQQPKHVEAIVLRRCGKEPQPLPILP
jgi:hypothetical protein